MSENRICCNCRHNIRTGEVPNIKCYCDIDGSRLGYVTVMTHWCRRWAEDKWDKEQSNDL